MIPIPQLKEFWSTLDMISKSVYLEEGDYIEIKASADNDAHAVCSFEELS
jgi:hypothetical protein